VQALATSRFRSLRRSVDGQIPVTAAIFERIEMRYDAVAERFGAVAGAHHRHADCV
jgi:hypothetical protein